MTDLGKWMVFAGLGVAVLGAILWAFGPRLPSGPWLPGDISIQRGNFSFHFPIVTCFVLSVVLTLLFRLLNR